jgi:hypothetical protein
MKINKLSNQGINGKFKGNEIASGNHRELVYRHESTYEIPVNVNGQIPSADSDQPSPKKNVHINTGENLGLIPINGASQNKQHTTVIIDNSHARGCTIEVKYNFNDNTGISGIVKSETRTDMLTSAAKGHIKYLIKYYVTVIRQGTRDAGKNNTHDGLKHIVNSVINNSHTNVILMGVPHQPDLATRSCVNKVKIFNRKSEKLMKIFEHIPVVKLDLNRVFYLAWSPYE